MEKISKNGFVGVVAGIKNEIRTSRVKAMMAANSELVMMYFRIGRILYESSLNDVHFLKRLETELKLEFPGMGGLSVRNLQIMRQFYVEYKDDKIAQQLVAQLSWSHNVILLSKVKDPVARELYVRVAIENGWSRNVLAIQIEGGYHKRVGASANNFKETLPEGRSDLVNGIFKDPYVFDFLTLREGYKEKELEAQMIERIRDVLLEMGNGWSFVGNQYKLTVGDEDYYLDLLFYHLRLRCYVVVELKVGEFMPEFAGKMNFYLSAVDELVRCDGDNPTIGLILCREKNRLTAKYALKDVRKPIGVSSFMLREVLPEEVADLLPTEEELNLHMGF